MKVLRINPKRGQTALEYAMVVMVVVLPFAMAIRSTLTDSKDKKKDNLLRTIVNDSYGQEEKWERSEDLTPKFKN